MLGDFLYGQGIELLRAGAVIAVFLTLERLFPIEIQPIRAKALNLVFAIGAFAFISLAAYGIVAVSQGILRLRYEFLRLSNFVGPHHDAFGLGVRIVAYLLVVDFLSYWRHRAMHALPLLWRIHQLHHSETCVNTTTARRDHWLNEVLYFLTVAVPSLALFGVFDVPAWVLYVYFGFPFFAHANIPLRLGPLTPVLTGPQLHRIHHSRLVEHRDKNFAPMFPPYDMLFGTYLAPRRDEFAPTGLITGQTVDSQWEAPVAPFLRETWRSRG